MACSLFDRTISYGQSEALDMAPSTDAILRHIRQRGLPDEPVTGVIEYTPVTEDITPGNNPGPTNIQFLVMASEFVVLPVRGDILVINGISYTLYNINAPVDGSLVLRGKAS